MSWFENQVSYSREKDDEELSEAFVNIAGSIVGHKIAQAWQNENIAARSALENICKYYHCKMRDMPNTITEINSQLDYIFQPCGIMRRSVKLTEGWHKDAIGAMLGTEKATGKVVALIPGKMGSYTYRDTSTGKMVIITAKTEGNIDSEAIVFYRPFPLRPITIKDLIAYMQGCLDFTDVFWYIVTLGVVALLGLIMPALTNVLFSKVTTYNSVKLLIGIMVFMLSQMIATQIISGVKALLLMKINTKLSLSVQAASYMRMFAMPADFFRNYTAGELSQHISYMNQLCNNITNTIFSTGLTSVFSLVYITQLFKYAPALAVPALIITLLTLVCGIITVLINIKTSRKKMDFASKDRSIVYSLITGIQKVKLCGAEKRAFSKWAKIYAKESELSYSPPLFEKYSGVITTSISLVGTVILYFVAVRSHVSVADYYSFSSAYAYITAAFTALVSVASTFAVIKPVIQIIEPIMNAQPELSDDKEVVERLNGNIEISHVSFTYPDTDIKVIDDLSIKIKSGQYVAIVGESGCGKSTLLRLLLGFENPQKGAIYYDGKNIEHLDKRTLRRKIGVVMQGSKLMWGDIYSNIVVAAPQLTLKDAWDAAEIAGIADDIREMPMGMNTIIQEGSGGISGGQRQRIMIARAIAPKPKVLFLDEATSALDNITQKKVSEALDKLRCTRIVIAHRLSTIKQCDRILLLKNGKIAEDGTYEELIAKNGLFADLVSRQMLNK